MILAIILLSALVVRLINITFPVGGYHHWRQADTAAVARNFHEEGYRFCYPQIDWRGSTEGYVESEFPLYNYSVALLYGLFGEDEVWGRLLSAVCGLLTVAGLFVLVRLYFPDRVALWSAAVYAFLPLNVFYSRAFMPEAMMLMFSVWALYHFGCWLRYERLANLVASAVCLSLAILLKLPALYLGLPILVLAVQKYGLKEVSRRSLWAYAAMVLLPVAAWYAHAHALYGQTGLTYGILGATRDKWGMVGPLLTLKFYNDVFFKSIAERHLTYGAFFLFVYGLFLPREKREQSVFHWWLLAVVVYIFIVPLGNLAHDYYQLPIALPASVIIGRVFSELFTPSTPLAGLRKRRILKTVGVVCILATLFLGYQKYASMMRWERTDTPQFHLAAALQTVSEPGDLVIVLDNNDPLVLYRSRRKGWHMQTRDFGLETVAARAKEGAKYFAAERQTLEEAGLTARADEVLRYYPAAVKDSAFIILDITGDGK